MVISRKREPQQLVRLCKTTLCMATSLVSVTCQKALVSVLTVCVKSARLPLIASGAAKVLSVVLCTAVPLRATFAGIPEGTLVSKPIPGGAAPVSQFAPGKKAGCGHDGESSAAFVGTRIRGTALSSSGASN